MNIRRGWHKVLGCGGDRKGGGTFAVLERRRKWGCKALALFATGGVFVSVNLGMCEGISQNRRGVFDLPLDIPFFDLKKNKYTKHTP